MTTKSENQPFQRFLIGGWELPPAQILAPMAGITDSPYRKIARQWGAGLLYTECVSAEGLRRGGRTSLELTRFEETERPIAVQLFGNSPEQFAEAAAALIKHRVPDLIDVNCGCPVKKFVTRGCGGWMMQDPELIGRIVEAVRRACGLPVSVKLRSGYHPGVETAVQAAVAAEQAGAALIAVHARFVRKAKGSAADWDVIGRVVAAVNKAPVIGNGDVNSLDAAIEMMARTGCHRVMVARWACGKPWIFRPLRDRASGGEALFPSHYERMEVLLSYYRAMQRHFPALTAVHRMRKHIGWFTAGMPFAAKLRGDAMKLSDSEAVIRLLLEFQSSLSKEPIPAAHDRPIPVVAEDDDA